jgi:hypothetical protein
MNTRLRAVLVAVALSLTFALAGSASASPRVQPRSTECGSVHAVSTSSWFETNDFRFRAIMEQAYTAGGGNCSEWRSRVDIYMYHTAFVAPVNTCMYETPNFCYSPRYGTNGATITAGTTWIFVGDWYNLNGIWPGCHWQARSQANQNVIFSPVVCV